MNEEFNPDEMVKGLESFSNDFKQLGDAIQSKDLATQDELRQRLQRATPRVTNMIIGIVGDGHVRIRYDSCTYRDLLANALLGDNYGLYEEPVNSIINKAIGAIEAGLWPPKTPTPVLVIHDDELRERCSDLLRAPNNYDRVVREATTILENRIRRKPPHDVLTRLIPNSGDQIGETLVNKLFKHDKPILSISSDKTIRLALHKILIGIFSYLRNPYHHRLDDQTEWSWSWSIVGLIDQLLLDVDSCTITENQD